MFVFGLMVWELFFVFKILIELLIFLLFFGLFKIGVWGWIREELICELKKNEIGKFFLFLFVFKVYGILFDEVLMKWVLVRVEMGVNVDFGLLRKFLVFCVYLKFLVWRVGWWKFLMIFWGSFVYGLGIFINMLVVLFL